MRRLNLTNCGLISTINGAGGDSSGGSGATAPTHYGMIRNSADNNTLLARVGAAL